MSKLNRFSDALLIQQGACNPMGVVYTLQRHMEEFRNSSEHQGTQSVCEDPALRLIVHQLAWLMKIHAIDEVPMLYSQLTKECEQRAEELRAKQESVMSVGNELICVG